MERNANYALVGLSTMILFIGLAVFAIWLAQSVFGQPHDTYRVLFRGPVNGLSVGGEVHFNGIKVGEVRRIILDPGDPRNVVAYVSVDATVPIREDSYATLEPMGITGVNFIQISAGTSTRRLLRDVPRRDNQPPLIHSRTSALSDLLAGGGTVLVRATEALDRINRVLSNENIRTLSATLSDVQAVTAELRERRAIIADAQRAIRSADQAAQEIRLLAQSGRTLVDRDGRQITQRLLSAAEEIEETTGEVREMVRGLSGPTNDFAATGLPQLQATIASLQTAADTLNRLATEIEQNPRGLVSRPPAQEVEVPQ